MPGFYCGQSIIQFKCRVSIVARALFSLNAGFLLWPEHYWV